MSSKGVTNAFRKIDNFDKLPEEAASRILYEELVPACETKGVKLSREGNHAAAGGVRVEEYNEAKAMRRLFKVTQNVSQYRTGSYRLKHVF